MFSWGHGAIAYLFGWDLDHLPYREDCDSQSALATLGTFTVAQGAGLAFGVQGQGAPLSEDRFESIALWLLFFYCLLALYTLGGIVRILRATCPDYDRNRTLRMYSRSTIHFGRWILPASAALSLAVGILGLVGWLPGQTKTQARFLTEQVACRTVFVEENLGGPTTPNAPEYYLDASQMNRWIDWTLKSYEPPLGSFEKKSALVLVESVPFDQKYATFTVTLSLADEYRTGDAVAFLRRDDDSGRYRPRYRQLAFERDSADHLTTRLIVESPDRGERLWLIVQVFRKDARSVRPDNTLKPDVLKIQLKRS